MTTLITAAKETRITPILIENPESSPTCDKNRNNPDFDICSDIFLKLS